MVEPKVPARIAAFWRVAPERLARAVTALSAAVALTDDVALQILKQCCPLGVDPSVVVQCLHECDFVLERNSEWQLEPGVRSWLTSRLMDDPQLARTVHGTLLRIAEEAAPWEAGTRVPVYLTWGVGRAYHTAATDSQAGLALYVESYPRELSGEQWLTGVLAEEQQQQGVLPADAIEPLYFRGITAYREGRFREAEAALSRVAESHQERLEVAIALHLLGVIMGRRGQVSPATQKLEESLKLLRRLGDLHGQAQVLHTWGRLIGDSDGVEAERKLRESLKLLRQLGDPHGQAQVLHTWGRLLRESDPVQADRRLKESMELLRQLGDRHGHAQVLNSLGDLAVRRAKWEDARDYYRRSMETSRDPVNLVVAHLGLARIADEHDGDLAAACEHMRRAVEHQRTTRRSRDVARHEARLRDLEARLAAE